MAITYADPIIWVDNYGSATPATLTDVWNADVAGAWGVFTKHSDIQFENTKRLVVGAGTNQTYMKIVGESYYGNFTSAAHYPLVVNANGHLNIGTPDGTNARTGAHMVLNNSTYHMRVLSGGECNCNGLVLHSGATNNRALLEYLSGSSGSVKNSIFAGKSNGTAQSYWGLTISDADIVLDNIVVMYCAYGLSMIALTTPPTGLRLINCTYGLYANLGAQTGTVLKCYDASFSGNTTDIYLNEGTGGGCSWILVDPTGYGGQAKTIISVASNYISERYSWQPTVLNSSGAGLQATLSLQDGKGTTVYTGTANTSGQFNFTSASGSANVDSADTTIVNLTYRTITGTSETEDAGYKTHVATFTLAGYLPHVMTFDMDETRKGDPVTMEAYTTPAAPTITTSAQTVYDDHITIEGTSQADNDIYIELQVDNTTQVYIDPTDAGGWSAPVVLSVGDNEIRAREVNENDDTSAWSSAVTISLPKSEEDLAAAAATEDLQQQLNALKNEVDTIENTFAYARSRALEDPDSPLLVTINELLTYKNGMRMTIETMGERVAALEGLVARDTTSLSQNDLDLLKSRAQQVGIAYSQLKNTQQAVIALAGSIRQYFEDYKNSASGDAVANLAHARIRKTQEATIALSGSVRKLFNDLKAEYEEALANAESRIETLGTQLNAVQAAYVRAVATLTAIKREIDD